VVDNEKAARELVAERKLQHQESRAAAPKATLEELFSRVQSGEERELRLIVKADVQGSLEPIVSSLNDLGKEEISINILHAEAGNIGENDVMLAAASHAIIIGFNVQADTPARRLAEAEGVSIRTYEIIYRMIEDVEKALKGMLEPEIREVVVGQADVLMVFHISRVGNIAGCKVTQGEIRRNGKVRVKRNGEIIFTGDISSLKHEKEDVREVRQGYECGIGVRNFDNILAGDVIECFILEKNG